MGQRAVGNQRDIGAFAKQVRLADFERVPFGQQIGNTDARQAQEAGAVVACGPFDGGGRLDPVSGGNDG